MRRIELSAIGKRRIGGRFRLIDELLRNAFDGTAECVKLAAVSRTIRIR